MSNEYNTENKEDSIEESSSQKRVKFITSVGLLVMAAAMAIGIGFLLDIPWWIVLLLSIWAALSCGGGVLLAKKHERNRND